MGSQKPWTLVSVCVVIRNKCVVMRIVLRNWCKMQQLVPTFSLARARMALYTYTHASFFTRHDIIYGMLNVAQAVGPDRMETPHTASIYILNKSNTFCTKHFPANSKGVARSPPRSQASQRGRHRPPPAQPNIGITQPALYFA